MPDYFAEPSSCSLCGYTLFIRGAFLYCDNKHCISRSSGSIKVWVDRLGLMNWGDSIIDSINKEIHSIAELYDLSIEQIALHCSGVKHAKKCYDSLHNNKDLDLELVLSALNIPCMGISTSTDIVNAGYDNISKVLNLTPEDLERIPNIGKKTAEAIYDGIVEKTSILNDLSRVINIKRKSEGPLTGKSICITGNTNTPRRVLQRMIIEKGGISKETVVSGLTWLVTNEDPSRFISDKMKKARKYNVGIMSEDDLLKLMNA